MLGGQELGLSSFNALRCVNLDLKDTEDTVVISKGKAIEIIGHIHVPLYDCALYFTVTSCEPRRILKVF